MEDVDSPLVAIRPVKSVLLVVVTGDRGLCGGYNTFVIKKAELRHKELTGMGINVRLCLVGKKGMTYFKRRPQYEIEDNYEMGAAPTIKEAQAIADEIFADFVSQEVDKVEMSTPSLCPSSPPSPWCRRATPDPRWRGEYCCLFIKAKACKGLVLVKSSLLLY